MKVKALVQAKHIVGGLIKVEPDAIVSECNDEFVVDYLAFYPDNGILVGLFVLDTVGNKVAEYAGEVMFKCIVSVYEREIRFYCKFP